jgi:hypothetical protein
MAVDPSNVYWVEADAIMKAPIEGGPTAKLADVTQIRGLVSDGEYLYWTDAGEGGEHQGSVKRAPVSGGAVELLAEQETRPWGITVDDKAVYWVTNDDSDGSVNKRSKSAPPAVKLVAGQGAPVRIVADGTNVYWTNAGNGNVMTAPK